jgi:hypothetical protein
MATKDRAASTWNDVSARNAAIEKGIPAHGQAHLERSNRLDVARQKNETARKASNHADKPSNPSGNALPVVTNRPVVMGNLPKALKKQA